MRDHKLVRPRDQRHERVLDQRSLCESREGGLVEDQDLRVLRITRAIATRWLSPPLSRCPRSPMTCRGFGQPREHALEVRLRGGREHLLVARVRPPVREVLAQRRVEQERVLQHEPDVAPSDANVSSRSRPVDAHRPCLRVVEARHELAERRLAGAARPDERRELPRLDPRADTRAAPGARG